MQFVLPGSAVEEKSGRRDSNISKLSLGVAALLHTSIWEHEDGVWAVTHQFSTGLELHRQCPDAQDEGQSRVQLPSSSLRSLQLLRTMLRRPGAIALDILPADNRRRSIYELLLGQLGGVVSKAAKAEALEMLERGAPSPEVRLAVDADLDIDVHSVKSEDLIQPENGAEGVDISLCPLRHFASTEPAVALARLDRPLDFGADERAPVRYAMLVLCSSTRSGASLTARELGRAFATAVMDEDFSTALQRAPPQEAERVLQAFDAYLSNMTIVPTVYVQPGAAERPDAGKQDCLLADSIVEGIEKLICKSRALTQAEAEDIKSHHQQSASEMHPPERRLRLYVEVNMKSAGGGWRVTRRLLQGLELDTTAQAARPHLPHVSVNALARARQLMTPASVGLGAAAPSPQAAVSVILHRLSLAGLPLLVSDELSDALTELIVDGDAGPLPGGVDDLGAAACEKLLEPNSAEEACHVLTLVCKQFPRCHSPVAAFVRVRSPLCVQLPSATVPARFFIVLAGPEAAGEELKVISDSLAALSTDEDLMGDLAAASDVGAFIRAFDDRLSNITIVPHTRVNSSNGTMSSKESSLESLSDLEPAEPGVPRLRALLHDAVSAMQRYSLPLVVGVLVALIWSNIDMESYTKATKGYIIDGAEILGHPLSLKFIVNDIFMCFFFGLAIKEVTEALLPGGSLSPLSRAINPLMATIGGIVGPAVAYVATVLVLWAAGTFEGTLCSESVDGAGDGHRRLGGGGGAGTDEAGGSECSLALLLRGWGVPTATDISLAWMFAIQIFGAGHPAINFLLLLAIVDDAIGMGIIAICYPDPHHPVEPVWLLLVVAAALMSYGLRRCKVPCWHVYIILAGPVAWLGLLKAHVHPALALVLVVPFMPASHAAAAQEGVRDLGACDLGPRREAEQAVAQAAEVLNVPAERKNSTAELAAKMLALHHAEEAPLHVFEHSMKLPVDLGMLFFGLANAGVKLNNVGGITAAVLVALLIGKTLGIALFGLLAVRLGFGLPAGVTVVDLFAMSAVGGVGLTVALFVANEAFADPGLQGQAKFGAVLSITAAGLAWAIKVLPAWLGLGQGEAEEVVTLDGALSPAPLAKGVRAGWIEDCMVDDILHVVWLQRRYAARGTKFALRTPTRSEGGSRVPSKVLCPTPTGSAKRPTFNSERSG